LFDQKVPVPPPLTCHPAGRRARARSNSPLLQRRDRSHAQPPALQGGEHGMDDNAFRLWAKMMVGKPNTLIFDAMIAATALVNRMVIVTRNTVDVQALGVALVNPFKKTH
jgi:predicted nucleic acid-binding protein